MLKSTKILSKASSLFLALTCSIGILVLSLVNTFPKAAAIEVNDKFGHTIAYLFLTFFWLIFVKKISEKKRSQLLVALVCVIFGIIIEVLQHTLTVTRAASVLDVLANTLGVSLAYLWVSVLKK